MAEVVIATSTYFEAQGITVRVYTFVVMGHHAALQSTAHALLAPAYEFADWLLLSPCAC